MKTTLLLLLCYIGLLNAQTTNDNSTNTTKNENTTNPKKIKNYEKLKEKHRDWKRCALIFTGDTLFVRIKYKDEYSTTGGFHARVITVAYEDESEKNFYPEDFSAFIVYGYGIQDNTKYLSIAESGGSTNDLYKVIIEGNCQLLFCETLENSGTPMMGPHGTWTSTGGMSDNDEYYVYYKGILTKMKTENNGMSGISFGFKNNCRVVFADCPFIVEKINKKEYTNKDLATIVKEFNQCLDNKQQAQKKY